MKLSENIDRQRRWMYNHQARLPFAVLPPAAIVALLLARPFGLISESWCFHTVVLLVIGLGISLRWYTSGYKEVFGIPTHSKTRSEVTSQKQSGTFSENYPATPTTPPVTLHSHPATDPGSDSRSTHEALGVYSLLRHPLELSDILLLIGALLAVGSWSFIFLGTALTGYFFAQIILTKERQQEREYGDPYTTWCKCSTALRPQFKAWSAPRPHQFSIRQAAHNTASRLLWISLVLLLVNLLRNRMIFFSWEFTPFLLYSTTGLLFLYLVVRLISRRF